MGSSGVDEIEDFLRAYAEKERVRDKLDDILQVTLNLVRNYPDIDTQHIYDAVRLFFMAQEKISQVKNIDSAIKDSDEAVVLLCFSVLVWLDFVTTNTDTISRCKENEGK